MGKIDPIARVVTIVGGSWRLWAAAMMCLAEQGLYLGKCSIVMPNAFLGVAEFWSWATPRFGPRLLDSDKLRDKPEFACHDFGCNELRMLASVEILRQGRLGTKRSLTFRPEFTFFPHFFPYMYVYSHTHIYIHVCMYVLYIYGIYTYMHMCNIPSLSFTQLFERICLFHFVFGKRRLMNMGCAGLPSKKSLRCALLRSPHGVMSWNFKLPRTCISSHV